jgi:tripartite-type tricarboxylate transporter receptor subunit TctC
MLSRRKLLVSSAGAALAAPAIVSSAFSQDAWPNREIHAICMFPAGSGADIYVRFFAKKFSDAIGKPVLVENKVGSFGNIANEYVARSKPDGYTMLIHAPSAIAANMSLFKEPGYDATKAFDVLGSVCRLPFTVSVSPNSPHKTLESLIVEIKKKGDKASYGTTAPTGQVAGALMKSILKIPIVEVPYRTAADSVNDLNSGNLDYMMYDPIFAMPKHRAGTVRVLAISSKERMTTAPDIPTMHESGVPGVDVNGWWGVAVPTGVPQPIKDKIADAFRKMAEKPETKKWLADLGGDPWAVGPAEAQARMLEDIKDWAGFVKVANLPPQG